MQLQVAESGGVLFHGLAIINTLFEHKGGLKVYLVPDHLRSHSVINVLQLYVLDNRVKRGAELSTGAMDQVAGED